MLTQKLTLWMLASLMGWLATHSFGNCQNAPVPPTPPGGITWEGQAAPQAPEAPQPPNLENLPPEVRAQVEEAIRQARANGDGPIRVMIEQTEEATNGSPATRNCRVHVLTGEDATNAPDAPAGPACRGSRNPQMDSLVQQAINNLPEGAVEREGIRLQVFCSKTTGPDGTPRCEITTEAEPLNQPGRLEVRVQCMDVTNACCANPHPGCCAPGAPGAPNAPEAPEAPNTESRRNAPQGTVNLSPNPANQHVDLTFNGRNRDGDTRLTVRTLDGREVRSIAIPAANGETRYRLNTQDLPAGSYLLQLQNRNLNVTRRLVLER